MLKIQEIREIIKLIDQSSIEKFTFESNGEKIKLEKGSGQSSSYTNCSRSTYCSAGSACRTASSCRNSSCTCTSSV